MSGNRENPILKYFDQSNFTGVQRDALYDLEELAQRIQNNVPDSAEKSAGLRKLLEAQDCFLRALE